MAGSDISSLPEQMRRLDDLLQEIERLKDPAARAKTRQIVQALMDFHGAAVEKMLELIAASGEGGVEVIRSVAQDDLVSNLLLLYGLHPLDLESRVEAALEKSRPYLQSHGGNVQLLGIENTVVRLRLAGSCHGCPSSAQTLKQTIEEAILQAAPDVTAIELADEFVAVAAGAATGVNEADLPGACCTESRQAESTHAEPGRYALPILSSR